MRVYNSWRGTAQEHAAAEPAVLRPAIARAEGIDAAKMLLLVAPDGAQLKDTTQLKGAEKVFVYDKMWSVAKPGDENAEKTPEAQNVGDGGPQENGPQENGPQEEPQRTEADTGGNPYIVLEGAQLVYAHMRQNLEVVARQLRRLTHARAQLEEDVRACASWQHYHRALAQLPTVGSALAELLDAADIEESYGTLTSVWSNLDRALTELGNRADDLRRAAQDWPPAAGGADLDGARQFLVRTLERANRFQQQVLSELRHPLAVLNDDLRHAEELKSRVARVIDLPFLYGVLLIERSRREKWNADVGPLLAREDARRKEWTKRYTEGQLGELVQKVDEIGQVGLATPAGSGADSTPEQGDPAQAAEKAAAVDEYLRQLDKLDLKDVSRDLRGELGAMRRQFAKSMSASVSSLLPEGRAGGVDLRTDPRTDPRMDVSLVVPGSAGSADASSQSTTAAYEARLRKLETMLMQARLGSKTHEMDIVRAEARAEARAEIRAEQQQARVAELEARNRELATRLARYTRGLESVLNSMGLQTTRVDETGQGVYRVNRVKGLSRRTTSPDSGESVTSNPSVSTPSSSVVDSTGPEKLLEQTFVDNQVLFEAVNKRFGDVERLARKLQVDNRRLRDTQTRNERDLRQRVALHSFRAEDLILFLPTRDPRRQPNPWAAFNAAAPHYFLHPRHTEQLRNREYLIARAAAVERHVVEPGKDNPYDLPLGAEWFLITIHGEWCV